MNALTVRDCGHRLWQSRSSGLTDPVRRFVVLALRDKWADAFETRSVARDRTKDGLKMAGNAPPWDTLRLPLANFAAEMSSPYLTLEQHGRLSLAWPRIWLAGQALGCRDSDWRLALGYDEPEWESARPTFARILNRTSQGWALQWLADEMERQTTYSDTQRARSGKPRLAIASPSKPRHAVAVAVAVEAKNTLAQPAVERVPDSDSTPRVRLEGKPCPPDHATRSEAMQFFLSDFWPAYPRRVGRKKALAAYLSETRNGNGFHPHGTMHAVQDGLGRALRAWKGRDSEKIPHAVTWLNQRRWEDEDAA